MGLIRAGAGALGGTIADQWKEFFCCDAIDKDTLVVKGVKRITSRSSNTRGNDNIISNGSGRARRIYLRCLHGAEHLFRLSR